MGNVRDLPTIADLLGGGFNFVGYFDTFADLPTINTADALAYVRTTTGVPLINRRKQGVYRWNGSVWEFAGDAIQTAANTSYDNTTSGLTATLVQDALDEISLGAVTDHGALAGLGDDDHTQYLNEARHDALPSDNPHSVTAAQVGADPTGTAAAAVTAHEAAGDPHPQYTTAAEASAAAPVQSVNTQTGAVVLDTDDVAEGSSNLYYTEARVSANASVAANTAKVSADGSVTSHSDVTSAGSGQIITAAERTQIGTNTTNITSNDADIAALQARLDIRETVYEVYEAGTTASAGTFNIIDMDTERAANAGFSLAGGQVTVNFTGTVKITYTGSCDHINNNTRSIVEYALFQNGAQVVGTNSYTYNRNIATGEDSTSRTAILTVTSGDTIDLRFQGIGGSVANNPTVAGGSGIVFERIL